MKKLFFPVMVVFSLSFPAKGQTFQSKHFSIQKLADGVYAAISRTGGYAICNAGIIDLGDATLIFDPFMTPEAAEDLKKAADILTGHKVKYIVNSHFHNDHIGGNQVFDNADIISTERTRELISKFQPEEIDDDKKNASAQVIKMKAKDTSTMNRHEKDENIMWLGYYEALATSANMLKVVLPGITFKDKLILHEKKKTIMLLSYGEGHTESDLFLYLPDDKIAFLGDLLFIQNQPWLGDGNPRHWLIYLDSIAKLPLEKLVPGHGPVGTIADIDSMKKYFQSVDITAKDFHAKGKLPADDPTLKSPAPFDNWYLSNFYKPNVIAAYNRLFKK